MQNSRPWFCSFSRCTAPISSIGTVFHSTRGLPLQLEDDSFGIVPRDLVVSMSNSNGGVIDQVVTVQCLGWPQCNDHSAMM